MLAVILVSMAVLAADEDLGGGIEPDKIITLEKSNIIGFSRSGKEKGYYLLVNENELVKLLITYKNSFLDTLVDRVIEMWGE